MLLLLEGLLPKKTSVKQHRSQIGNSQLQQHKAATQKCCDLWIKLGENVCHFYNPHKNYFKAFLYDISLRVLNVRYLQAYCTYSTVCL